MVKHTTNCLSVFDLFVRLLLEELSFFYGNEGSTGGTEEFVLVRFCEFVNTVNSVGFTLIGGSM